MSVYCAFETSVTIYQSTWRNITEDLNLQQHSCENIKYFTFSLPY
jgi:hypothetical protein